MSVTETVLVFVGVPLAIVLVISGLAALGGGRAAKRYRPGRPFEFAPVWFLSAPEQLTGGQAAGSEDSHEELPAGTSSRAAALPAGSAAESSAERGGELVAAPTRIGPTGGASDRW